MSAIRALQLALAAALTLFLSLPGAARAGTYVVRSCHGTAVGNAAWTASASAGLTAYDACPLDNLRPSATGLANRTQVQAGNPSVPGFAAARHRFEAPPGAGIRQVTFSAGFYVGQDTAASGWRAGLWGMGADGAATKRWGDCSYGQCSGAGFSVGGPFTADLAGASAAEFLLICVRASCPAAAWQGGGNYQPRAWMNPGDVSVTVQDSTVPLVRDIGGPLWADGWHRGSESVGYGAQDNVGVAATSLQVDETERGRHTSACDYTRPRPCPDVGGDGYTLDTQALADGEHAVYIGAVDAADNHSAAQHTIRVDNHAPAPPRALALAGGEGWRHVPRFSLAWTNPGGQVAPIAQAHWTACRAPAHGGGCAEGSVAGEDIAALDGLAVPEPGDWTVRVRLEDAAGNTDPAAVSDPVHVRFDPEGPDRLGFLPRDPADPRRVEALIADAVSGPAGGRIEIRRSGGGAGWIELPTALSGERLTARLDEAALKPGLYDGRVTGRDAAGNERTSDRYEADGSPFTVSLPARTPTRFTAPAGKPVMVRFGARRSVSGRLVTSTGQPVAGGRVEVRSKAYSPLARERRLGGVRTGDDGTFTYLAGAGPSRALRFIYDGTQTLGTARAVQGILVRAAMTLRVDRRRVRNGRAVLFTGRLRGGPVPRRGKLIDLQAYYRGRWRTFATVRSTRKGVFRARYRFEVTHGRVVYRFRAMARREAVYPYELGISPQVRVTVNG